MSERWLPIAGFVGIYEVSDLGRVRCIRARKGVTVGKPTLGRKNRDGYLRVGLYDKPNPTVDRLVHVLVLEAFAGPAGPGEECRHLDGDPSNNRLTNLVWGTPVENAADRKVHGTHRQGESHHSARLKQDDVDRIKASSLSQRKIAAQFGISQQHVSDIRRGNRWAA